MSSGNGEQDELIIDLDAFRPPRGKSVKFQGHFFPVVRFVDLTMDEVLFILRVQTDMKGKSFVEQVQRAQEQVSVLCPAITKGECCCEELGKPCPGSIRGTNMLRQMSSRMLVRLASEAMEVGEVPLEANVGESESPSGSPALADSTAGQTSKSGS